MKILVALFSASLAASPALAQAAGDVEASGIAPERGTPAQPRQASEGEANEGNERRICRRISATQSRLSGRRLCMTAREWREYYRD